MNRLVVIAALFPVFFLSHSAFSLTPQLINYQGRLLDGTNLVNGVVGLSLRLYNTPTGGSPQYEDSNQVTVTDGLYSTFIGDNTTAGSLVVALTNTEIYIEVAVNNTALSPRERIVSVAYAFQADRASLATTADTLDGIDSSSFLRSDTSDTFTSGTFTFAAGSSVLFDSLASLRVRGSGAGGVFGSIDFANSGLSESNYIDNPSFGALRIHAPRGISILATRSNSPQGTITLTAPGGVTVNGNLTVVNGVISSISAKSFEVADSDPADGDNNLYRLVIEVNDGHAVVPLPIDFQNLNEDAQVWVSPVGHFGRAWGKLNADGQNIEIVADQDGRYNVLVIATHKTEAVDPATF